MIDQFTEDLTAVLGDELKSVVLYGGAARDETRPGADVNTLVILKRLSLPALSRLEPALRRARRRANVVAVFWTEEELRNSSDVFPIEFLDILRHRKVVYGADPFAGLSVDTKNLRHQVEFEFRSKLLRLRAEWPSAKGSTARLADLLGKAGTSFCALFPHAQTVAGGKVAGAWKEPFEKCVELKRKELRLSRPALEGLYEEVHDAVSRISAVV